MTLSVVLRLVPGELLEGRIVGEAELVETGERRVVRSIEELVAFLSRPNSGGEAEPGDRYEGQR